MQTAPRVRARVRAVVVVRASVRVRVVAVLTVASSQHAYYNGEYSPTIPLLPREAQIAQLDWCSRGCKERSSQSQGSTSYPSMCFLFGCVIPESATKPGGRRDSCVCVVLESSMSHRPERTGGENMPQRRHLRTLPLRFRKLPLFLITELKLEKEPSAWPDTSH